MKKKKSVKIALKSFFILWILTLGFHVQSDWYIYTSKGRSPNNWKPLDKPHVTYLVTQNEKSIGVPLFLTYNYDEKSADFKFFCESGDPELSEVIINELSITYPEGAKPVVICENQSCNFKERIMPEWQRKNAYAEQIKRFNRQRYYFSYIKEDSIKNAESMDICLKYQFIYKDGTMEDFIVKNEKEYRKRLKVKTYWNLILEGIGASIGGV